MFLEQFFCGRLLFFGSFRSKLQWQISELKPWFLIRNFSRILRPSDRGVIARESLLEHFTDRCRHDLFVARNSICFLFDKKRDVRILFKTVTHTVEMEIETLLP